MSWWRNYPNSKSTRERAEYQAMRGADQIDLNVRQGENQALMQLLELGDSEHSELNQRMK